MFKNLLLVTIRNFKRDKGYSLLNILGLTIGITFSLLIIFYIKDELSYDNYHEKGDRIFRVNSYIKEADKDTMKWAITPFPMAPALKNDYPEVEEAVRFVGNDRTMFKNGDKRFYELKTFYADSNVFRVFTYPFLEGNPQTALVAPNSIVLTQSMAIKYFGKGQSYVGKTLESTNGTVYNVTGVTKDVPANSHLIYNMLISRNTLPADYASSWGNFSFFCYVLLKPNTSGTAFEKKLAPMFDKYLAAIFKQYNITIRFGAQPIKRIHLHSDMANEPEELGSMSYIYIFSAVAFFMLLIACINYMNLTTARSARRAKEIGIRKVTGSSKAQLVVQFLMESTVTALFALLLSIGLVALLLPSFNDLAGKSLSFQNLFQPQTLLLLLGVVAFVGLVGGSYPAFYLAKFNPVKVLKGSLSKGSSNIALRRVLVVTQFSVSIIMLICTWVVYSQLNYLRNKDLGFNKEQVLNVAANSSADIRSNITSFINEARKNPNVIAASTAQAVPGNGVSFNLFTIETDKGTIDKGVDVYGIDEHYFPTLGMKIVKGRNFNSIADTLRRIIVNESMVKEFAWGDNVLGRKVRFPGDTTGNYLEVIGVVKDFNQKSLYNRITPLILFYSHNNNVLQLKLASGNIASTITSLEKVWQTQFPNLPFEYTFLDQDFNSQYAADQKRGKIFTAFAILTILVTCLGLLGLIAFTTEQRQKEIGIRKVLGAGINQIVPLLTKNFVVLVFVSCFIAFPVAWYFMKKWLDVFPYNTGLTVLPFISSAIIVLMITLLTVAFHAIKAALINPVKSLKSE